LMLLSAVQNIRFQMNEKGVVLRSEAEVHFGCAAMAPMPEHIMVFDRPFMVMMLKKDAPLPYFALWVDNAELLVGAQ
jgi:hypothetical protein